MRRLVLAMLLAFVAPLHASDDLDAHWMQLIRQDFDSLCAVHRTRVGTAIIGNNGHMQVQWFMHTCRGDMEYAVSYYPPSAFPERDSPYEVKQSAGLLRPAE